MTLEEAIKFNEELKAGIDKDEMPRYHYSVQLGIEALRRRKRIRDLPEEVRSMYPKECFELLPGETE